MTLVEAAAHISERADGMVLKVFQFNFEQWKIHLADYPEQEEAQRTLDGIIYGEKLGYKGPRFDRKARNPEYTGPQRRHLKRETQQRSESGELIGGFEKSPTSYVMTSPYFTVPKGEHGFRSIHNLSHPLGSSINDGILMDEFEVKLNSTSDVMNGIRELVDRMKPGDRIMACKADFLNAYRQVCIAPTDYPIAALIFDGKIYYETRLPFGGRSSPGIFCRISNQFKWIVQKKHGVEFLFGFYDDFLGLGFEKGPKNIFHIDAAITAVSKILNFQTKEEKHVPPTTIITFLGIEYDLEVLCARIPLSKVEETLEKVRKALAGASITVRKTMSLLGSLVFVCCIVLPGRSFVSRIIARLRMLGPLPDKKAKIFIDHGFRADLQWFERFLPSYNGLSIILEKEWSNILVEVDASGWGAGGFCGKEWFSHKWEGDFVSLDIVVVCVQ